VENDDLENSTDHFTAKLCRAH